MPKAVICAFARTPMGKFRGALSKYSATELGTKVVKELIGRINLDPKSGIIEQVYMGQVLQAGSGQAPARQVAINAGLPYSTPCTTINKVCGSSLKAVMIAASDIISGHADVIIAGGMESMSNAPYFANNVRKGENIDFNSLKSVMTHDGLTDAFDGTTMGMTGEIVAAEFNLSREQSDAYAVRSHALANAAWENGWFNQEVIQIDELEVDQGIRPGTNMQKLGNLRTVFMENGQVTAGNSSQVSDGASAVLVCSEEKAVEQGWPILAEILDYTTSGVEPKRVMMAPISAVETLLQRNDLDIMDIDIVEHNEAFAAASLAVQMALKVPEDRFNVHGGAVAMGHPLGSTGTRCLMTTINALNRTGGNKGIVTICLGGGNAVAMLIGNK
ncbi:MAG: thiolase family protein [Candidatus Poseidoniales archaeon]|jgi:acetyl-CoA C-acetyltransferase